MTVKADKDSSWNGDILERQAVATYLTEYLVDRHKLKPTEAGFVLAIDAEWGFGKTYLVKNWVQDLTVAGYPALYFDAWKNDFTPEPLVAFIAEMERALRPVVKEIPQAIRLLDTAIGKVKTLYKPTTAVLLQIFAKKITGFSVDQIESMINDDESDDDQDADDSQKDEGQEPGINSDAKLIEKRAADRLEIKNALKKIYDSTLKDHADKAKAIAGFTRNLKLLIDQLQLATTSKLPVFVFVDELDRCRPNYALELLEGIKHLFGIPGVYFIIATNLRQLGHATRAVYGSTFEGQRYLKRFFDLEYKLPEPQNRQFAKLLFRDAVLPKEDVFFTGLNDQNFQGEQEKASLIFSQYANYFKMSLRDQQQVIRVIEASTMSLKTVHAHRMFFLAMLHHQHPEIFTRISESKGKLSPVDLSNLLSDLSLRPVEMTTQSFGSDGYSSEGPTQTHTSLTAVASLYYTLNWSNTAEVGGRSNKNAYDFPGCIFHKIGLESPRTQQRNVDYPPSISKYFDLIRHAGQFS